MDIYRIDSHKLMYHVDRVNRWEKGETVAPVYMEIAPSGGCNHRCIFCALDYIGYDHIFLDTKTLKNTIKDAAKCGVKSVMFAGEGEPLLHKDIAEIISFTKKTGIDVAVTTNAVFLKKDLLEKILKHLSWIRISLNAATAKNYQKIHRCMKGDFKKVISNLKTAVKVKRKNRLDCAIGVQILLIPENKSEIIKLARMLKNIGVDYLTIKPFSKHPKSRCDISPKFDYSSFLRLEKNLKKIEDKKFKILFRSGTMRKLKEERGYKHCLGLPFWAYISASGDVCACSAYLGDEKFVYGNIYKKKLSAILKSERRRKILKMAANKLNTEDCREICRLDEINRYLWEIKNPSKHINFI
ncbi:MAG: radical SAM protein [Candidatus Omnitrophota bacterium]